MATNSRYTGICLSILIISTFVLETTTARCCLSYNKRPVRCGRLKGYTIQGITGSCDLNAIVFYTMDGKSICANPTKPWTQDRVACLKEKASKMQSTI